MKKASITRNFMYQMIYEVLVLILPFVTSPYIARVLGAESVGIYSYTSSIAYYFILFAMLGIKNYGNRAIAQVRDNYLQLSKAFCNIFSIHAIFSTFFGVLFCFYAFFIDKTYTLYSTIQIIYVFSAFFDISWFYFGIEKFKLTVTRNTIIKVLNVISIFVFVRDSDDLWKYCLIMSLGSFLSQISLWFFIKKEICFIRPTWLEMKKHIKPLFVLFIPAIAVSLYKYMDKIMLGTISTKLQLGFYENAEKAINIPITIISAFGTVMLPKMSNLSAKGLTTETNRYLKLSMEYVMFLAFGLAFGIAGVAKVFAPVFWGEEFADCGLLIMCLAITIPYIAFANILRTQYLIPREKDNIYIVSVFSGAVVNLVINFLLVPHLGALGAVIGTIIAESTVCIIQTISVKGELPIKTYLKPCIYFILTGTLMLVIVYQIGNVMTTNVITLIVQLLIGSILYLLCGCIYFFKTKNEVFVKIFTMLIERIQKVQR